MNRTDWLRLVVGVFLVFALFHASATLLGSDRGQQGLLICVMVVAATAAADRWLHSRTDLASHLGLGRPRAKGIAVAIGVSLLLLAAAALFARARSMTATAYPGWFWLLPGLFAQAGIAEEVLFRAFLFGHLRVGRTFWRAAAISMVPFLAVHLVLFATMPWPIAVGSLALALVVSFPLAHLYELGGRTIWAPALLHFVIQATVKVVVFAEDAAVFALFWMGASAAIPLLAFAVAPDERAA